MGRLGSLGQGLALDYSTQDTSSWVYQSPNHNTSIVCTVSSGSGHRHRSHTTGVTGALHGVLVMTGALHIILNQLVTSWLCGLLVNHTTKYVLRLRQYLHFYKTSLVANTYVLVIIFSIQPTHNRMFQSKYFNTQSTKLHDQLHSQLVSKDVSATSLHLANCMATFPCAGTNHIQSKLKYENIQLMITFSKYYFHCFFCFRQFFFDCLFSISLPFFSPSSNLKISFCHQKENILTLL